MKKLILLLVLVSNYSYSQTYLDRDNAIFLDFEFSGSMDDGMVMSNSLALKYRYSFFNNISLSSGLKYIYDVQAYSSGVEIPFQISYKIVPSYDSENIMSSLLFLFKPNEFEFFGGGYVGKYSGNPLYVYTDTHSEIYDLDNEFGYGVMAGAKITYYISRIGLFFGGNFNYSFSDNIFVEKYTVDGETSLSKEYLKRMIGFNVGLVYRF